MVKFGMGLLMRKLKVESKLLVNDAKQGYLLFTHFDEIHGITTVVLQVTQMVGVIQFYIFSG